MWVTLSVNIESTHLLYEWHSLLIEHTHLPTEYTHYLCVTHWHSTLIYCASVTHCLLSVLIDWVQSSTLCAPYWLQVVLGKCECIIYIISTLCVSFPSSSTQIHQWLALCMKTFINSVYPLFSLYENIVSTQVQLILVDDTTFNVMTALNDNVPFKGLSFFLKNLMEFWVAYIWVIKP